MTSSSFDQPGGRLTILALTLNEAEGVKVILPKIDPSWYHQLLVVDGGSTDGTIEWCRAHGYQVYVQQRRGVRYAYFEALPQITGWIRVMTAYAGCRTNTMS